MVQIHNQIVYKQFYLILKIVILFLQKNTLMTNIFLTIIFSRDLSLNKLLLLKKKNIIAFGSCFAASVSAYLAKKNYSIFNKRVGPDTHIIRYGEGMANTFTVLEQLLWAFENKNIQKNTWYYSPKEEARNDIKIRNQTLELLKKINIFIITV